MWANYLIYCETCGAPRRTVARNTRYCLTCRYLNDAAYWLNRGQLRVCNVCRETEFLPFHNDTRMCHKCAYTHPDDRRTCVLCQTENAHTILGHDVCFRCATDPRQRRVFLAALEQRQAAQLERYGHLRGRAPQNLRTRPQEPSNVY